MLGLDVGAGLKDGSGRSTAVICAPWTKNMAGERVFIVEDDTLLVRQVEHFLAHLGYRPGGHAPSGSEALARLGETRPDIVLMDIALAGEMDGIEAARRIMAAFGLPVIYLTADDDPRTLSRALDTSPFSYIQKPVTAGQLHSALATALERHRLERRLKASEEKLAAILDALPSGILVRDAGGRIVWANAAAVSVFGPATGLAWEVFLGRFREPVPTVTDSGELELSLAEGQRLRHFILSETRTFSAEAGGGQTVAILREETERRALQAENLRAAHLASLGELAAGVAHEINNPISGIMGYAERLADKSDRLEGEAHIPGRILSEAERISGIVRKLLAFARPSDSVREPVDVGEVLSDALSLTRAIFRREGIDVELALSDDLPRVMANPQELQQVAINLLTNARQALSARPEEAEGPRWLSVGASLVAEARPMVRVSFADNGQGVPAEVLPRIFEPFFTTKPKHEGTGLGLAISLKLVQAMGGRLWLESREGQGATAFLELPVAPATPVASELGLGT
jgi:signal transduction histidine kinase